MSAAAIQASVDCCAQQIDFALGFETALEKNAPEFARQLDSLRLDQKVAKRISDAIESSQ